MRLLTLAFLMGVQTLTCNGCASPRYMAAHPPLYTGVSVPVYLGEGASPKLEQSTQAAVQEWNQVLNGQLTFQVSGTLNVGIFDELLRAHRENAVLIIQAPNDSPFLMRGVENLSSNQRINGICYPWGNRHPSAVIYVNERLDTDPVQSVETIKHELGHALGAQHQDGTLMQLGYRGEHCVDKQTAIQVSRAMNLDMERLNYCQ